MNPDGIYKRFVIANLLSQKWVHGVLNDFRSPCKHGGEPVNWQTESGNVHRGEAIIDFACATRANSLYLGADWVQVELLELESNSSSNKKSTPRATKTADTKQGKKAARLSNWRARHPPFWFTLAFLTRRDRELDPTRKLLGFVYLWCLFCFAIQLSCY